MSTNALMHEPNNELYVFDVCNNCETVFNKLVLPEIRRNTTPKTIYPTEVL
jgi:hypothetical protein